MCKTIGLFQPVQNEMFFSTLAQTEDLSVIVPAKRGARYWLASDLNLIYPAGVRL